MIDPGSGQRYVPTPSYFLGCFDIYDREETLGEELEKFDPNNPKDREVLIREYCLDPQWKPPYRQKFLMVQCLEEALRDESYDFQSLLKYDPEAYSSFPAGWDEMKNVRGFFEDIFKLALIEWRDDLQKASLEDQSTWVTVG
ncbi:hypothetical protein PMI21_03685 [Pseudomonas sp. GM18]|uniref:hypothetical protein n=1 Tax=Pseudomonas sp. GM18 TaxID=1144324 RepID=UPI000272374D|nr:hypothetical protein [Pseudomonas sp. GM18]EJM14656.1 hypothetical protein PMI21_03685 [Pseudomonas sp. GM18]